MTVQSQSKQGVATRTKGRWRCRDCGSTRISGIVAAYCLGRLDRDHEIPYVSDGEFVIHLECDVDPGSIMCENCGSCAARFEAAKQGEGRA